MAIKYFQDTDTLHIEFRAAEVAETRDFDENTQINIDKDVRRKRCQEPLCDLTAG